MTSKLILIRHGITEGNKNRWFYGASDIPLAAEGEAQLARLRDRGVYPELPDDTQFVISGLHRTKQTAEILFGEHFWTVIPKLKEMNFGEYECVNYEDVKDDPVFNEWGYDTTGDAKLPGGESSNEFQARIHEGLKELIGMHRLKEWSHRHSGKDSYTVAICHGGVISAIMMELFPKEDGNMWSWIPDPGLGYVVEMKDGDPIMFESLSEIKKLGFGLMRLPVLEDGEIDIPQLKEMVDMYMERGYTYFDTAYGYHGGKSETAIREALVERYPRDSFRLATKLPAWEVRTEEEAKAMFQTSLERCGVEYFDYYLMHNLGDERTGPFEKFGIWEFMKEMKKQGRIKNIGFSFHGRASELEKVLEKYPDTDFVQLQINYLDWEDAYYQAKDCYMLARHHAKPVIVMEPIKGGILADLPPVVEKVLAKSDSGRTGPAWALSFAMGLPGVLTVLSGMSNKAQLEENLAIADSFHPLDESEKALLAEAADEIHKLPQIQCTGCGYCLDGCPAMIRIPGIFKCMNIQTLYGNDKLARGSFGFQTRGGYVPSHCYHCGHCESVCPQGINIMEKLQEAVEMFEK